MNRYGQIALEHHQRHRPVAFSQIPDPNAFFTTIGEEIAAAVTTLRDEILGRPRPGEDPEAYRLRGYQALATAEELTLADHYLFGPDESSPTEDLTDDRDLGHHYRDLAEINQAINTPL